MTFATRYPTKYRPITIPEVKEAVQYGHTVLVAAFSEKGYPINHRVQINEQGDLEVIQFLSKEKRPFREFDCVYTYLG